MLDMCLLFLYAYINAYIYIYVMQTLDIYCLLKECPSSRFARVRKTFGKALVQQQVIRHKLANMARSVLATHGPLVHRYDLHV